MKTAEAFKCTSADNGTGTRSATEADSRASSRFLLRFCTSGQIQICLYIHLGPFVNSSQEYIEIPLVIAATGMFPTALEFENIDNAVQGEYTKYLITVFCD